MLMLVLIIIFLLLQCTIHRDISATLPVSRPTSQPQVWPQGGLERYKEQLAHLETSRSDSEWLQYDKCDCVSCGGKTVVESRCCLFRKFSRYRRWSACNAYVFFNSRSEGHRFLCVAPISIWNSLSSDIRTVYHLFRPLLKSHFISR